MSRLGNEIRTRCAEWGVTNLPLERAVFGTDEPDALAAAVDGWCRAHLGAGISEYRFFDSSSGSVHGVHLDDERDVVVKVHRPGLHRAYLDAVHEAQEALAHHGCAAPRPLVAPQAAPPGHITAEEMLGPFEKADGHDPAVRLTMAAGLAELADRAREWSPQPDSRLIHPMTVTGDTLYPTPHSLRFDFAATRAGAEWIDELASRARRRCDAGATAAPVLTHGDWRIDNLRVRSGRIIAIYDWDSLSVEPEAAAVATAARTFCCDWDQTSRRRFPSPDEIKAFIVEYEHARGAQFDEDNRAFLAASMVASLAYGARCEHSIAVPETDDTQQGMLRALGPALLTEGLDALPDATI